MAKATLGAISVPFSEIFWNKAMNERFDYANTNDIRNSLAERGWVAYNPVSVFTIETASGKDGKKSQLEVCMEERASRWEALKKATTPESAVERQVFEALFTKGGKLIQPKYSGNAGFRRASVYESAMVLRFKDKGLAEGEEKFPDQIPVVVKVYADEAERIVDQQLENEIQGVGQVKVPELNKLRIAMKLFRMGKREIYLRKLYKSTTGQKLFNLCQADHNWPEVRIYDRCHLPGDDSNQIPFSKVRHDALIKLNNRSEADCKRKKGAPLAERERAMEPIGKEEVANYFNDLRSGVAGNDPKIMPKKDIEAVAKQNAVDLFKIAFQAVVDNKLNGLVNYVDFADQLNLHVKLIDNGHGTAAALALGFVNEHKEMVLTLASALATGHSSESIIEAVRLLPVAPVAATV